jgi:hypothetical protein
MNHLRLGRLAIVLVVIATGLVSGPAAATEPVTAWCNADFLSPDEPLDSVGLGLTHEELDALYGPGLAAGDFWMYDRDGYRLGLANCNLEVWVDEDGPYTDPEAAGRLARTLLPQDAVFVGMSRVGSIFSESGVKEIEEWISPDLAIRYRALGQTRTGSILVVYTSSLAGPADLRTSLIQIGTIGIPR